MDLIQNKIVQHLENISSSIDTICPNLANFYRLKQKEVETNFLKASTKQQSYDRCPFCYMPFRPGNYHARLTPRPKLSSQMKKLLKKFSDNPKTLGKFQTKLVEDYIEGRNMLVITCLFCKKRTRQPGQSRIERHRQKEMVQSIIDATDTKGDEKPLSMEDKRKEKKKDRKKEKKKKRKAGLVDKDINAGLTLPNRPVLVADIVSTSEEKIETCNIDSVTSTPDTSTATSVSKTSTNTSPNKLTQKSAKSKTSLPDLKELMLRKKEGVSGMKQGMALKGAAKKKKMGQQLGMILKMDKNKPSQGSLSDFLSSL